MTPRNIVLLRTRTASKQGLGVYRWITRDWASALRQLLLPQPHQWARLPVRSTTQRPRRR